MPSPNKEMKEIIRKFHLENNEFDFIRVFCGLYKECGRTFPCIFRIDDKNKLIQYHVGTLYETPEDCMKNESAHNKGCNINKVINNLYDVNGFIIKLNYDYSEW